MYAKKLSIYEFKCFQKATLSLQYPGRTGKGVSAIANINVLLGDNGGGKSSVLRALAIAVLAPALMHSGFVPYRLVRRLASGEPAATKSLLKVNAAPDPQELTAGLRTKMELLARLDAASKGSRDRIHLEQTPDSPILPLLDDDDSPTFFVVGYGATRRVETGDYSPSSARRSRGLRYQRIAGLFEDHVALRPLTSWLSLEKLGANRFEEAVGLLDAVLPDNIRFTGDLSLDEDQYLFEFEGMPTPFSALSDGYKAFVGWVGDLLGNLVDVAPQEKRLNSVTGIVLVDEIDLHLHPGWQRQVVPLLAATFPLLQFILSSHSPLVASSVQRENIFISDRLEDGTATIVQSSEHAYGQSVEHILLSSYFGLPTTRPASFEEAAQRLFERAARGDISAAMEFLQRVSKP